MSVMVKKKDKNVNHGKVVIPVGHPNLSESHEENIAIISCHCYNLGVSLPF